MPGKTVAYIRVSTDGQEAGGHGLDVQRSAIVAHAVASGVEVDEWYQDVESGACADRPGLLAMMGAIKRGEVSRVLVYRLDRLARDARLFHNVKGDIEERAELVSVSEAFADGSPMGALMATIMAGFAAYERALIATRTKSGRRASVAKNGTFAGGAGVLGYRARGSRHVPGGGELVVIEDEAAAVRKVFELHDQGVTLAAIAAQLNGAGFRTMRGSAFQPTQIHRILARRDFYTGKGILNRSIEAAGAAHPAIL